MITDKYAYVHERVRVAREALIDALYAYRDIGGQPEGDERIVDAIAVVHHLRMDLANKLPEFTPRET